MRSPAPNNTWETHNGRDVPKVSPLIIPQACESEPPDLPHETTPSMQLDNHDLSLQVSGDSVGNNSQSAETCSSHMNVKPTPFYTGDGR